MKERKIVKTSPLLFQDEQSERVCTCCMQIKSFSEFYSKAEKGKMSVDYKPRAMCISCYNMANGKNLSKIQELTNSYNLDIIAGEQTDIFNFI